MSLSPFGVDSSPELVASARVRELASGVDALYMSAWVDVPGEFLRRIDQYRAVAAAGGASVPFTFGGVEFGLAPYGWGRYRFRLSHEYGLVGITPGKTLPPLRIQPRADILHGLGVESTVDAFRTIIDRQFGLPALSVSRVDLFADWQGWEVSAVPEEAFVTRAKQLAIRAERGRRTGLEFGRRSSGSISGRIYDKSLEAAQSKKTWWWDIWGDRYADGVPVWRTEFEFNRGFLREMSLDTPEAVLHGCGDLWAYATEDWLSHRTPSEDQTRSRWPVSEAWEAVQQASLRGESIGLKRVSDRKTEAELKAVLPVLRGCLTSASAQWGADSIAEAVTCLTGHLHEWEQLTGHTVAGQIAVKRRKREWGL